MIKNNSLLSHEQAITPATWAVTIACAITGLVTYAIVGHSVWLQWSVFFHLLTGVACSFALLPYLVIHFRRTIGFRRMRVLISGLVTIVLYAGFVYSGWHMMLGGQKESEHWVYLTHIIFAGLFITLVVLHLVLHIWLLPKRRKQATDNSTSGVPANTIKYMVRFNVGLQILIAAITLLYQFNLEPYVDTPAVSNYEYDYGPHRFRPSQTETSNNAFIDPRQIGNSHRCISCHEDIGKQWFSSVHQQAASDPTYVTNISLLAKNKGISATRYCEGCHAPVALLTGELSTGGQHGGIKGTLANKEGISCMGCHGINALTHLKGVASFEFKPMQDYLFSSSKKPLLLRVNNLMIRLKPEQHKRDLGKPLFKDAKFCSTCHTQFMDKEMNNWGWVKMQDDYGSWLESPFSKQHKAGFANADKQRCQDCHMPLVTSTDPSADSNGKIRAHYFPGANTFLPILRGDKKQLEKTINFLQNNKLRISIDQPNRKDALQTLHALDESLRNFEQSPYYYYVGEKASINITVSNTRVGHAFPGGSIDINQAWVEFRVMDAEGRSIYSSGLVDEDNFVDDQAYFYRSLPVDKNGNLVWKHDLFNRVGESSKRVIKAGASDIISYSFNIPAWVKSPLTITATLKYRKLNERYARWALKEQYIEIPIVDVAWDSLAIPIKIRKEVEPTIN